MKGNICGNCINFKPRQGEKFFNCTHAVQAGVKYGMQVRADTGACEAFSPLKPPPKPVRKPVPSRQEPPPAKLCNWVRVVIIAVLIIAILLLAWGAYTCFSGGTEPSPTPTPTPPIETPTPTDITPPTVIRPTPTPAPTPIPINYFEKGDWVISPPWMILLTKVEKVKKYDAPGPIEAPTGTSFWFVTMTVTNSGVSPISTRASDFIIVDGFGSVYHPVQPPFLLYLAYPWGSTTLLPGKSIEGKIIFVVPDIASQLDLRIFVNGQYIAWVLTY